MSTPPWEALIDDVLADIKHEMLEYLETKHFHFEWQHWSAHRAGVCSRFRRIMRYYLGIDEHKKVYGRWPFETKTSYVTTRVLEHTLCAQFNLMYEILPGLMHFNWVREMSKTIVDETFNRLEPNAFPSLLSDLYEEYKTLWHAAEKIQIAWRRAISDPAHLLCQRRLYFEYNELTI